MKKTLVLSFIIFISLASVSNAKDKDRPIMVESPTPRPVPNVTKQDIRASGGGCVGQLCTDTGGRQWQCSNTGPCGRVNR